MVEQTFESPVVYSQHRAEQAERRLAHVPAGKRPVVARFIVGNLLARDRWQWKRHEIACIEGWLALASMDVRLADYWRIDNVYVIDAGLFGLDLQALALAWAGYTVTATTDGGYWLRQYGNQVQYYRRRGMAIRRALRDTRRQQ